MLMVLWLDIRLDSWQKATINLLVLTSLRHLGGVCFFGFLLKTI